MTPEELNEFVLPHTSNLAKSTVALFKLVAGIGDFFGSGVLLRIENTHFLVTAAHVAHYFVNKKWVLPSLAAQTLEDTIIILAYNRGRLTNTGELPDRDNDMLDLGIFELHPMTVERLSQFMRFVTLDQLGLDPAKLTDGIYLVLGYPQSGTDEDEMNQTIEAAILPYFTNLHDFSSGISVNYSPNDHLVLDVNRLDYPGRDKINLDDIHGISGCGIWRILDENEPIQSLDWRKAKLVAIETDRSLPEVMGPIQYLRGTKIKRVINYIHTFWPELRPAIEDAIPIEFVQ